MKKERLLRKIYLTRKARILLSEELKKKHDFYQILIIYYTVVIIVYSLYEITHQFSNSVNILVMSITLSFFTVAVQSQKHLERYLSLKQHYIKLDELYFNLEESDNSVDLMKFYSKYIEMLDSVENHSKLHYLKICLDDKDESERMPKKRKVWWSVFGSKLYVLMQQIFLVVIPFVIPFLFDMIGDFFS